MITTQLFHQLRYENNRWPLWRWDLNLRYIGKSFLHRSVAWTQEDSHYYQACFKYLASRPWEKNLAPSVDLQLAAVGDLMWIRSGWSSFMSQALTETLAKADLTLANLETPLVREKPVPKYVYECLRYNSDEKYLDPWEKLHPTQQHVFSLVNNHALDMDHEGLKQTRLAVTQRQGFHCLGGLDPGDEIARLEVNGFKISCLALTFGVNLGHQQMSGPVPGIPVLSFGNPLNEPDWEKLSLWIAEAKGKCDLLILMAHWGFEYEYWPDQFLRSQAHRLMELGVDVILGSSPHVLQPIEIVSINGADANYPV